MNELILNLEKGFAYGRQRAQKSPNQVINIGEDNSLGIGILDGWKPTIVWTPADQTVNKPLNRSSVQANRNVIKGLLGYSLLLIYLTDS